MKQHVIPLALHRSSRHLGAKGSVLFALEFFLVLSSSLTFAPTLFAQDFQPQPVSEYTEKSGPNTITFLSYPKYYTDSEGKLTPVVTDLVVRYIHDILKVDVIVKANLMNQIRAEISTSLYRSDSQKEPLYKYNLT